MPRPAASPIHSGMSYEPLGREIEALLHASRAGEAFKRDLLAFAVGRPAERVVLLRPAPRLKVLRLLTQLLDAEPALCVDRVADRGIQRLQRLPRAPSPCHCADAARVWRFRWDCRWRAEQEGWHDAWGLPDQSRAAREFGWRCFAALGADAAGPRTVVDGVALTPSNRARSAVEVHPGAESEHELDPRLLPAAAPRRRWRRARSASVRRPGRRRWCRRARAGARGDDDRLARGDPALDARGTISGGTLPRPIAATTTPRAPVASEASSSRASAPAHVETMSTGVASDVGRRAAAACRARGGGR